MHSNINIVTDNNYFFIGVKAYLHSADTIVRMIHPRELKSIRSTEFREDAFFIFYTSHFVDAFLFLIATATFPSNLIFISINNKVNSHIAFEGYTILEPYADMSSILNEMQKTKNNHSAIHFTKDKLTKREKAILLHTISGMNAKSISEHLSISIKTVYAHRRNALHKLGDHRSRI